jgi:hypothetical protein
MLKGQIYNYGYDYNTSFKDFNVIIVKHILVISSNS